MAKANLLSGTLLFLFSVAFLFFIIPAQIDATESESVISPRLVPIICVLIIGGLSLFQVVKATFEIRALLPGSGQSDSKRIIEMSPISKREWIALVCLSLIITAAILIFNLLGAMAASVWLLVVSMVVMGVWHPLPLIAIPSGVLLASYILFTHVLGTAIQ